MRPAGEHALPRTTRRQLLKGAGGVAGLAAIGGGSLAASRLFARGEDRRSLRAGAVDVDAPERSFRSRPDLRPVTVRMTGADPAAGYLLLGPGSTGSTQSGPLIVDGDGEPVWFRPLRSPMWEANFTAGSYRGEPVLSWWQGTVPSSNGYGLGEGVIVDTAYREVTRVRAARGRRMDVHEMNLTPEGTMLFTCSPPTVQADLSALSGPRHAPVLESVIQEVDVATGRLLMEWRSLDHIPVSESYRPLEHPYDYLHINSIDIAPDGNLLVSGRHTSALYKLDRRTGEVIWRLGGKRSDFALASDARFAWQHHARYAGERTITVFDNGSDGPTKTESQSRAIALDVDEARRVARLRWAREHPRPLSSAAMGSVQILPDGHALVGWGSQPYASEFAPDGTLVRDAAMPHGQQSYRAFRLPWNGLPHDHPAIAAAPNVSRDGTVIYASWNGATRVSHWQVHAGSTPNGLHPIGVARRHGFETAIHLGRTPAFAAVTALDRSARELSRSPAIAL